MTLALFALGALASAAGTRAAALPLVGAAAWAWLGHPPMAALAAWTAVLGAVLVLVEDPRSVAVPLVGAAAATAAASASSAAAVLGLWEIGTAAAVLAAGGTPPGRRFALGVVAADLPLVAALVAAAGWGLEGWPRTAPGWAGVLLALGGAAKAALGGADLREAGRAPALAVVRTQAVAAVLLAVEAAVGHGGSAAAGAVAFGAVAFGLAPFVAGTPATDTLQEAAIVGVAGACSAFRLVPSGWVWGALGAGTLIHTLRLRSVGRGRVAQVAGEVGLPFLGPLAVVLEGAGSAAPLVRAAAGIALVGGVGGRLVVGGKPGQVRTLHRGRARSLHPGAVAAAGLAVATTLWAPLWARPLGLAGGVPAWPPLWAVLVVGAGAVAGALHPGFAGPAPRPRGAARGRVRPEPRLQAIDRSIERLAKTPLASVLLGLWGVAAAALWVVGAARGFL